MNLKDQIVRDEGVVPHAYQDQFGYWTIGVGRLLDKRKGGGLSRDEVYYLLSNDINQKTKQLVEALPWVSFLSEQRQAVLINMCFQMGIDGLLKFKNTLKLIEDGHYDVASSGMLKSLWAQQTPERAKRLSKQMLTNEWQ
jgi:lysozyme